MNRLFSCFALGIVLAACSDEPPLRVTTIPEPAPPPFRGLIREIEGTMLATSRTYDVTAPASGTLVARLSWEPAASGKTLVLTLEDVSFSAAPPDWSPIVGRIEVQGGNKYHVDVKPGPGIGDWDDWWGFDQKRFVLTLSLE